MLTFNDHITDICKKSARQLAVLKRLCHLLTLQGKVAISKCFISSNFNYCPLIWQFVANATPINLRKSRREYFDSSTTTIYILSRRSPQVKTAGAEYLHIKRVKEMAREVFTIVNNIAPTFIENIIAVKHSQYSLRNDKSAVIPRTNTTKYGLNSFAHEGARIWNSLTNVFRVNENYREFSRLIQNWSGPTCKCIICRQ